jgi:hypothetical protein
MSKILNKLKKDESKSLDENGKVQSVKLKNISSIRLESEFSNIENINHFILLFNFDILNVLQTYYVNYFIFIFNKKSQKLLKL